MPCGLDKEMLAPAEAFWSSLMLCFQLNKNEAAAIDDHPYWGEVAERPNVLLLGDSLTDMQVCCK
jgi:hypothetical protein